MFSARELGAAAPVEPELPFTGISYPSGETRRAWQITLQSGVTANVAWLLKEKYKNGVGAPGHWRPVVMVGNSSWRERMKEKQRAEQKKRRAALAADPRVQAMKEALKQRLSAARQQAKERRKLIVDERKRHAHAEAIAERAERAAELRAHLQPATRLT